MTKVNDKFIKLKVLGNDGDVMKAAITDLDIPSFPLGDGLELDEQGRISVAAKPSFTGGQEMTLSYRGPQLRDFYTGFGTAEGPDIPTDKWLEVELNISGTIYDAMNGGSKVSNINQRILVLCKLGKKAGFAFANGDSFKYNGNYSYDNGIVAGTVELQPMEGYTKAAAISVRINGLGHNGTSTALWQKGGENTSDLVIKLIDVKEH